MTLLTPANHRVICLRAATLLDPVIGDIEGYIAIWGDPEHRDSYDTWFDQSRPPEMTLDNGMHRRPITYEHTMDAVVQREIIGYIDAIEFDNVGIKYRGHLDRSCPFFPKVVSELRAGLLKTSSGTMNYIADFYPDGAFKYWLLGELALTQDPAESRMPASRLIRSTAEVGQDALRAGDAADISTNNHPEGEESRNMDQFAQLLQRLQAGETVSAEEMVAALQAAGINLDDVAAAIQQVQAPAASAEGQPAMSAPQMLSAYWTSVKKVADTLRSQRLAREQAEQVTRTAAQQAIQQAQMQAPPVQPAQPVRSVHGTIVNVGEERKFAGMDAVDMAMGYMLMESQQAKHLRGKESPVTETYMRAMAYKTAKKIESGDKAASDLAVVASFRMKDGKQIRANEIMQSTAAGFGDEWVGQLQGTELQLKVRMESTVYKTLLAMGMDEQELPQGFEGETVPIEGSEPTWYVAAGAQNLDSNTGLPVPTYSSSKFGTGQSSITVAKLSVALYYQKELEEDSLITIATEARRKIEVSAIDQIDYIALNGDTATGVNTNINAIDGTPASAPSKPSYTLLNGLLKLALITNTSNAYDASGVAFDEKVFLTLLSKMAPALRQDKTKLLFLIDSDTALAALNISTFKTRDVFNAATIENGELLKVWKIAVLESGQMSLANASGMVQVTTPAGNTKGRVGLARPDQWMARWKRRMQMETTYYPRPDTTEVVAHIRFGMGYRDSDSVAVAYGIDPDIT